MTTPVTNNTLDDRLDRLEPTTDDFAPRAIDAILAWGREQRASDIHLHPTAEGLELKYRIDGVLRCVRQFPKPLGTNLICRLKVMAELLTYQTDKPQEGRLRSTAVQDATQQKVPLVTNGNGGIEMRVSTFPTLHGERAVVRIFSGDGRYTQLDDLGFPARVVESLRDSLSETSGAILVTGPAGSGKTTTIYACLREIVAQSHGARSLVSLEDPIEVELDGVAQSQVDSRVGLDLATGLRFLMRQDPEVIMVGEIRDRATAEAAFEASLSGHLLLSTFHAGDVAEALGRLADMGIEPYILRSGLLAVLSQRLVRRLCDCAQWSEQPDDRLGMSAPRVRVPVGCPDCLGTGYRERLPLVEMVFTRDAALSHAILGQADVETLRHAAVAAGMVPQPQLAEQLVGSGRTSPAEIRRVLGLAGTKPINPNT